jgi:hypothetical protein
MAVHGTTLNGPIFRAVRHARRGKTVTFLDVLALAGIEGRAESRVNGSGLADTEGPGGAGGTVGSKGAGPSCDEIDQALASTYDMISQIDSYVSACESGPQTCDPGVVAQLKQQLHNLEIQSDQLQNAYLSKDCGAAPVGGAGSPPEQVQTRWG